MIPIKLECLRYKLHKRKSLSKFTQPATRKGPKLYVVKQGREAIYVGITSQSISSRLRYGFTASGKHGYHGYKWKDKTAKLDLLIWCFPDRDRRSVECIEAEVVFLIRKMTGRWPAAQTEIHFHNASKTEIHLAQNIYKALDLGSPAK